MGEQLETRLKNITKWIEAGHPITKYSKQLFEVQVGPKAQARKHFGPKAQARTHFGPKAQTSIHHASNYIITYILANMHMGPYTRAG